ncbi:hypothetical protein JHK85_054759 [Glycine max]|nr:hypothetical protein JHK85_054759 [Glycine max]
MSLVYVLLLSSRVCVIVFSVSEAKVGANTKNTFEAKTSLMTTLFGFHALLSTSLIMRPQLNAHWGWTGEIPIEDPAFEEFLAEKYGGVSSSGKHAAIYRGSCPAA